MKQPTERLDGYKLSQLMNCVRVAKAQFEKDAKMFAEAEKNANEKDQAGVPFITRMGARRMKELFESYATEAGEFYDLLERAEFVTVTLEEEEAAG